MKRFSEFVVLGMLLAVGGCVGLRPPPGVHAESVTLLTTGYCRCGACCSWKRNWLLRPVYASGPNKGKVKAIGITASGRKARKGTIAADTALYPFGTIMYIEGYGYGRVEDRGGAIKGNHVDLFFNSHRAATVWGRRTKTVKVWRVR